jgi:hypothetical protein
VSRIGVPEFTNKTTQTSMALRQRLVSDLAGRSPKRDGHGIACRPAKAIG